MVLQRMKNLGRVSNAFVTEQWWQGGRYSAVGVGETSRSERVGNLRLQKREEKLCKAKGVVGKKGGKTGGARCNA